MTFPESIRTCLFSKYATIEGRASRSEFWWFTLLSFLIGIFIEIFSVTATTLGGGDVIFAILPLIIGLAFVIPVVSVTCRRLHDLDQSAAWAFIIIVPLISLILLLWLILKGTAGNNRFGPDPTSLYRDTGTAAAASVTPRGAAAQVPPLAVHEAAKFSEKQSFCQSCGQSVILNMRVCPQCGGRTFAAQPPGSLRW
jgi:uncharacterized membrane protein YhaH (DUF805 family)/ribosomal protein S27AE